MSRPGDTSDDHQRTPTGNQEPDIDPVAELDGPPIVEITEAIRREGAPVPRRLGRSVVAEDRALGWAEFGHPDGDVVLWFHGTPGAHPGAAEHPPERPGAASGSSRSNVRGPEPRPTTATGASRTSPPISSRWSTTWASAASPWSACPAAGRTPWRCAASARAGRRGVAARWARPDPRPRQVWSLHPWRCASSPPRSSAADPPGRPGARVGIDLRHRWRLVFSAYAALLGCGSPGAA